MSSAGIQKLFCGIYSMFKCSFDEFVGEKVFSLSYSSAILAPPPKRLFSSYSLSAIMVVSSAYLRLLIFLLAILIPACAPLSMGFPRQEYWCGLHFPTPGDFPDPGLKSTSHVSPALASRFF